MTLASGARGAGFNFDNSVRNAKMLATHAAQHHAGDSAALHQLPRAMKTGTTIVGVIFEGGVVLAADTRATEGPVVADKMCKKIHLIAPNILCCGAGTAADTETVTMMISSEMTLRRLETRKQSRVIGALTMLKRHLFGYQGYISAALVLGGVDVEGPFLGTVAPHGNTDRLPFVAMGSGSLAAMAVLEAGFQDGLTLAQAKDLVTAAVCAGIFNDPMSGTQVDVAVITKDRTEITYGFHQPNADVKSPVTCSWSTRQTFVSADEFKPAHPPKSSARPPSRLIALPPGTTPIKREEIRTLVTVTEVPVQRD